VNKLFTVEIFFDILTPAKFMENKKIIARIRDPKTEKPGMTRRQNEIPAVLYGKNKEGLVLAVSRGEFEKVYREAGHSAIVDLDVDGKVKKALIQEVAEHVVTDDILHADFYEVSMTEKITTTVPLKFVGDSTAVLDLNGTLITNKSEIEIECLPMDLPHEIEVDLSVLSDFEATIHVSDIKVSDKVEVKDEAEELIASVEPPRTEEELAELEEPVAEAEMPESEHGSDEVPAEEGESTEPTDEKKEE
jgi:large subunit ribosomal protein L25